MDTEKLPDEKLEIRQHNVFTTASQQLSALEMDILFCLFWLLRKDDCPSTYYSAMELYTVNGRSSKTSLTRTTF